MHRPYVPFSQPTYLRQGYAPVPSAKSPVEIVDAPFSKEYSMEAAAALPPFPQSDTVQKQTRQGKLPLYLLCRWQDSTGNATSKNYHSWLWTLDEAIDGYSLCTVISCTMSSLYSSNNLLQLLGVAINEFGPTARNTKSTSLGSSVSVSPTFMIPNIVYASTATQNPQASLDNYFAYYDGSYSGPICCDVRGLTFRTMTVTLCDESLAVLVDGSDMTGYNMNLMLRFE